MAHLQELLHLFLQTDHGLLLCLLGGKRSQNYFSQSNLSFSQEAGNTYRFGPGGIVIFQIVWHHWETSDRYPHLDWSYSWKEIKERKSGIRQFSLDPAGQTQDGQANYHRGAMMSPKRPGNYKYKDQSTAQTLNQK